MRCITVDNRFLLLLLLVLFISFLIKITLYVSFGTEYWGDEIIATTISKQNIPMLLNTVQAEPHPPGFYIFLKLFPTENMFYARFLLVLLSYLLVGFAIYWGCKTKIIEKYNLFLGLALFFCSYTFLELTAHVRHEIISFPLFLLYFLTLFSLIEAKPQSKKILLLSHFLILLLSTLGYIYYLTSLSAIFLVTLLRSRQLLARILLVLQILLFCFYFYTWIVRQFLINLDRLSWHEKYFNSFFNATSFHLAGTTTIDFFSDIAVMLFLSFVVFSFFAVKKMQVKSAKVYWYIGISSGVLIFISYFSGLFVRTRYSSVLFLLLSILAGWGLSYFRSKTIIISVIVFLFSLSMLSFASHNVGIYRGWVAQLLRNESRGERFGFLEDNGTLPLEFVFEYKVYGLVPVHLLQPNLFEKSRTLERKHLILEGSFHGLSDLEIRQLLYKNGLKNYFYRFRIEDKEGRFDPKKQVLRVLDASCTKRSTIPLDLRTTIFVFRECSF